jgi:lysophospholipase L1-like esterase
MLALVGTLAAFWYLWLDRSMGSGPAGPSVPRDPFSRIWTRRPVLLLGLGDSVTAGFGATEGHSYLERLVRNPPDELSDMRRLCLKAVLPSLRVRNRAISGSTSRQHLDRQVRRLPRVDAGTLGLVVMTTGGNDIIHNYGRTPPEEGAMYGATLAQARPWIVNFERRLERMLAILKDRFPGGCRIFLANIYDPTDGVGTAHTVGLPSWKDGLAIHCAYNETLARVAARHPSVRLVDIQTPLLGHGIYCRQFWRSRYRAADPTHWFYSNFEDPNDRGYDAIRRAFLMEMAEAAPFR